jgi:transcriptional regulator with XRE-family HTH domain
VPNRNSRSQDPALVALGRAIRQTRLAASISQEGLAHAAEVDRSYVGRIERGENAVAVLTLIRLAAAMGTTASALMRSAGF